MMVAQMLCKLALQLCASRLLVKRVFPIREVAFLLHVLVTRVNLGEVSRPEGSLLLVEVPSCEGRSPHSWRLLHQIDAFFVSVFVFHGHHGCAGEHQGCLSEAGLAITGPSEIGVVSVFGLQNLFLWKEAAIAIFQDSIGPNFET